MNRFFYYRKPSDESVLLILWKTINYRQKQDQKSQRKRSFRETLFSPVKIRGDPF